MFFVAGLAGLETRLEKHASSVCQALSIKNPFGVCGFTSSQRLAGVLTLGGFWTIEVALFVWARVFRENGPAMVCLGRDGIGMAVGVAQAEAVCEVPTVLESVM